MFQLPPPPPPLPDVIVTGARLPPAAGEAAFSVIRLDEDDLRGEARLDEALGRIPAVSLFRRTSSLAANPTTQGISLRGIAPSGAGRTLVTLDGVPLNDPFGGWVIWSQVPVESLSGLDVVRGAGSGPYGAGALTGVIQLRERDQGLGADAAIRQRGGQRLAALGGLDAGPGRVALSGLWEDSDGYVPVRGPDAGPADTPLDLRVRAAAARFDVPVGRATASIRASAFEEERGSGLAGARATAAGDSLSAGLGRNAADGGLGYQVQVWRRTSDLANTSVAVAPDRSGTTPANDQFATPATGWGANGAVRGRFDAWRGGRLDWELGADARLSEGETRERFRFMSGAFTRDRRAGGRTSVAGGYGEAALTAGPWLIAAGARLDRWRNTDGRRLERDLSSGQATLDEGDPDRAGTVASGRAAIRRELGSGQAVRLAAYSGFRPATLNELHRPFRVGNDLTEANAGLEPERLAGVEAGWAWTGTTAFVSVTAFATRLSDAIVNVTVGEGPALFPRAGFVPAGGVLRERRNAGVIEATGLELQARAALSDRLAIRGALSGTDARVDGGPAAPQLTGLRPAQAPIWSATTGFDWTPVDRLAVSVDARWESRRFDDDLNSRPLAAAAVVDGRVTWRVSRSAALWFEATNLTDADVQVSRTGTDVLGLSEPRTFGMGLSLSR